MYKPHLSPRRRSSFSPIQPGRRPSIVPQQYHFVGNQVKTEVTNIKESHYRPYPIVKQYQTISPEQQQEPMRYTIRPTVHEQFIPIEVQKLKFEVQQRDHELANIKKLLAMEIEERSKLRTQLEAKTEDVMCKEREITKLLAVVHQLQGSKKSSESKTVKSLHLQVESLEKYISKLSRAINKYNPQIIVREDEMKMQLPNCSQPNEQEIQHLRGQVQQLEEEKGLFLGELEKLTQYLNGLVDQNSDLQQQCQSQSLELQRYKLLHDEMQLLEQELRGKGDEVRLLREQLCQMKIVESVSKEHVHVNDSNSNRDQLQHFLEKIRTNYLSKEITLGDDDDAFSKSKAYSFESRVL